MILNIDIIFFLKVIVVTILSIGQFINIKDISVFVWTKDRAKGKRIPLNIYFISSTIVAFIMTGLYCFLAFWK